jgi:glycosyltransferase involved in cell wall biosynthesis
MRVALLSHSAPAGDAIGRQLAEKVAFFLDRGANVRVFVSSVLNLNPALKPFTHRYSPAEPSGPNWQYLQSADLVCVEYSQHDPLTALLPLLAGDRPRIIFDYHGVTPPNLGGMNHRDVLERGCRNRGLVWTADAAVVHSRFAGEELNEDSGYPRDRAHVVGLPVDTTWFTPGRPEDTLRSKLGIPANARLLLFVGRLAPNKRVPLLIEAVGRLGTHEPAVHAVIVGDCGGAYSPERDRCRERAARLGVADRLHFLGRVDEGQLRDAYRDADALVIPSVHEGFCIPVVEAMACGTPVVAARAAALPETIGDAGLTFNPDDGEDLARVLSRLLAPETRRPKPSARKIAVVTPRYGTGFVGGAETSLRTLANAMSSAGCDVEVFTLGLPEGSVVVDQLPVYRCAADPTNADRHAAAEGTLRLPGAANGDMVADFLDTAPRSSRLVRLIRERGPFDAIVVGPYLHGIARDVAAEFGDRVILVPCFHDEPFARLSALRARFDSVGGVLYHSPEERAFAEAALGFNHPNAHVVGTLINADAPGDASRGRRLVGTGRRYVLYCGRYCREKGLSELLSFARRYAKEHPERFTFSFAGAGDVAIPAADWARNCGLVGECERQDLMAGADALLLLSPNESLSLVCLEAQAQGTPIIVRAGNAVLEGHLSRGAGGVTVDGYEEFAAALDDLWADEEHWRDLGRDGREYVRRCFIDAAAFEAVWRGALEGLDQPLAERLLTNGLRRAMQFDRPAWRESFGRMVDHVLEAPRGPRRYLVDIAANAAGINAGVRQCEILLPVRLNNRGDLPMVAEGFGRAELVAAVHDGAGKLAGPEAVTALPRMLTPGRSLAAVARVMVPATAADYKVSVRLRRAGKEFRSSDVTETWIPMTVSDGSATEIPPLTPTDLGSSMRHAMAAHVLPSGYVDVSTGRFGRLKCWLKRKLLHNFQKAYVDVLSRQQSAFNGQVLAALAELHETQAAIAHAAAIQTPRSDLADEDDLRAELRRVRGANRRLRRRVARLEAFTSPNHSTTREAAA